MKSFLGLSIFKSIKEHKGHNKVETAVGRGEMGAMGDSMEGEKALRFLYHEWAPDLTEIFVWIPADVHKPQGCSLSLHCEYRQGSRVYWQVEVSERTLHALRGAIHRTQLSMTALSLHDPLCSDLHHLCKLPTQLSLHPCKSLFHSLVLAITFTQSLEVCCQQFKLERALSK